MTVCIAAASKHEGKTAIVLCCDWQGTKGDYIKSDSINKMRWVSSVSAMIAGAPTNADELLNECDRCVKEFAQKTDPSRADLDMNDYLDGLRKAVAKRKQRLVEEHVALTRALDIAEFWKNGRAYLGDAEHAKTLAEIREVDLGCSVVLASIAADGGDVIVRITPDGRVLWENEFVTIGSGAAIAEAFLNQYDWGEDLRLEDCLHRVYSAKLAAEKNPQVGPTTSFEILEGQQRYDLSDPAFQYLKKRASLRPPKLKFPAGFLEEVKDENGSKKA